MTETPAGPVAGWYPDPEDSQYLRWWNGHQWELRKPLPGPRSIGRGFGRLSQLLGVLLTFNLMLSLALSALYAWGLTSVYDAALAGDLDKAETFDGVERVLSIAGIVSLIATGIVWMTWQHRLAAATRGLSRSPAMHAFSWIIPIGNLWLPIQNVRDLWRRLIPLRGTGVLGWWWAGWIGAETIGRLFVRDHVDTPAEVRDTWWAFLVVASLAAVTALLAIQIVRALSRAAQTSELVTREGEGSPAVW